MKIDIKFALLFLIVLVMIMAGAYPIFFSESKAQQKNNQTERRKKMIPISQAKEEEDLVKRSKRQNKNRFYNYTRGADLETQEEGEIFGRISEAPPSFSLPISESDLIIVGKVVKSQPFFSETKTSIYSEFSIQIEEIIKNHTGFVLAANKVVVADREGGAIILPNGRILQYVVSGIETLPEQNLRYVFFLKNDENIGNYKILTGYELNANGIIPLEDYEDRKDYIGKTENNFLKEVKSKISTNQ